MKGNTRIYRLPKGHGQASRNDIARAGGLYHDWPKGSLSILTFPYMCLYQHPSLHHEMVMVTWRVFNQLMYAFYSDMQYSCLFGELEFEPNAVFKFMMLLCKSQLKDNEHQVA